ncbi:hypothetical protein G7Y89_g11562 [Cudoniella acicularis]|uniref:Uncharacterized protein n=1 Tax=Cudoniella acicularis TaxID=354080 RepID=A0A8H4RC49_9HELO|nr:hypothetical protein G7Y89_g11562 [Cudoniella acicularis]
MLCLSMFAAVAEMSLGEYCMFHSSVLEDNSFKFSIEKRSLLREEFRLEHIELCCKSSHFNMKILPTLLCVVGLLHEQHDSIYDDIGLSAFGHCTMIRGLFEEPEDVACSDFAQTRSTRDAAAVKILTIITLIYLPTTIVANFFSTQFVQKGDNGQMQVADNVWLLAAISIPLTVLTIVIWWFWVSFTKIEPPPADEHTVSVEHHAYPKILRRGSTLRSLIPSPRKKKRQNDEESGQVKTPPTQPSPTSTFRSNATTVKEGQTPINSLMSSIINCITGLFQSKLKKSRQEQEVIDKRPQPAPSVAEITESETLDGATVAHANEADEAAHNFISGSIEEAEWHHLTEEAVDQAQQPSQTNGDFRATINHRPRIPTFTVHLATLPVPLVISTTFSVGDAEYRSHSYSHSPSPSLETPRLSRHNSDASPSCSRSGSKASSTTEHWLKDQLEDARIEWPENSHIFFIPKFKQEELITVATVTKDILAREPDIGEKAAVKYANDACRYARQLYATLAYIKKGAEICSLLREGVTDEDLPLVRKSNKTCRFALYRKNGQPIKTVENWKDKYLENFHRVQWWMIAPVFVPGEHHKFEEGVGFDCPNLSIYPNCVTTENEFLQKIEVPTSFFGGISFGIDQDTSKLHQPKGSTLAQIDVLVNQEAPTRDLPSLVLRNHPHI